MTSSELKEFLDFKVDQYNTRSFIDEDPIRIPHQYSAKEDIEISAFLMATIAWGNRKMILRSGDKLVQLMGKSPYDFVMTYSPSSYRFVHRTFNAEDLDFYFRSLRTIYEQGGLEPLFARHPTSMKEAIVNMRNQFLSTPHLARSTKHISNPANGSAAKRINMFLRWMVRKDAKGVDFGIWNTIDQRYLYLPLDVHTATVSRKLGLLKRTQNDWKSLEELMSTLRNFDAQDPVKYDFALFGIGAYEKFSGSSLTV